MPSKVLTGAVPIVGTELKHMILEGDLISGGYIDFDLQLTPLGFDMTVEKYMKVGGDDPDAVIDFDNSYRKIPTYENIGTEAFLLPGEAVTVQYNEKMNLPYNVFAIGYPRSTLLRCSTTAHSAVWDAGYEGRGKGLIHNVGAGTVFLMENARVMQMMFWRMDKEVKGYNGAYQNEGE